MNELTAPEICDDLVIVRQRTAIFWPVFIAAVVLGATLMAILEFGAITEGAILGALVGGAYAVGNTTFMLGRSDDNLMLARGNFMGTKPEEVVWRGPATTPITTSRSVLVGKATIANHKLEVPRPIWNRFNRLVGAPHF